MFRLGATSPFTYENGLSNISIEDYAIALIDKIQNKQYIGRAFTIGY